MKTSADRRKETTIDTSKRAEQLRRAKRAQRTRERERGLVVCEVKLPADAAERLRAALKTPGFERELARFLDETLIDIEDYPNLKLLCWNRTGRYVTGRDALALYERHWREIDVKTIDAKERALIDRLVARYGNGVFHV